MATLGVLSCLETLLLYEIPTRDYRNIALYEYVGAAGGKVLVPGMII